jgi:hypothetical protein
MGIGRVFKILEKIPELSNVNYFWPKGMQTSL